MPRPGHDDFYPETQAAVAGSSTSSVAHFQGHGAPWGGPVAAQDWSAFWHEQQQQQVAIPPPLAPPPLTCPAMQFPTHYPVPPSPQTPTAAIQPPEDREDNLWLKDLVKDLRAENKKMMDELLAERSHRNDARLEVAEAQSEVLRLTARHAEELAEVRMEAATAAWRNGSWCDNRWRGGPL